MVLFVKYQFQADLKKNIYLTGNQRPLSKNNIGQCIHVRNSGKKFKGHNYTFSVFIGEGGVGTTKY